MFNYTVNVFTRPDLCQDLGFQLPTVYAAWVLVLALLYPLYRWLAGIKSRRRDWWLSYL
jgi:hypothetical protein